MFGPNRAAPPLPVITIFAPLEPDAVRPARDRLAALAGARSPFADVPGTHFARLLLLPEPVHQQRPQHPRPVYRVLDLVTHLGRGQRRERPGRPFRPCLVLSAGYDPPPGSTSRTREAEYVDLLRRCAGPELDAILRFCSRYPGTAGRDAFARFFAEHSVPAGYVFTAAGQGTVEEIRAALALRRQVGDLALEAQGCTDEELAARFAELFGADGRTEPKPEPAPGQGSPRVATLRNAVPPPPPPRPHHPRLRGIDRADVQGLVASGFGDHLVSAHLLLRVADPAAARTWLGRLDVTPAERVLARRPSGGPPRPPAVHVALSHAGLRRLGVPQSALAGFAPAFRDGMARREGALLPSRGTATWRRPWLPADGEPGVDAMLLVSAGDAGALDAALATLRARLEGVTEIGLERGERLPMPDSARDGVPLYREHFGFADGLSQPAIRGLRTSESSDRVLPAGEFLLGHADIDGDMAGAELPDALCRNGTFLVYRKLEQDVPAFRRLAASVPTAFDGNPDTVAEKLIGRRRDGVPLAVAGSDPGSPEQAAAPPRDDFGYQDHDPLGERCPIGAHVRRANPRDSRPVREATEHPLDPVEPRLARRHRMLRRGIPSGPYLPDGATAGDGQERGLLFLALVGDIERQFEFVQAQWMGDGNSFRLGTEQDVLSGADVPRAKVTLQGNPPVFVRVAEPVVTCRGGEYLLLPGLTALRWIAAGPR